MFILIFVNPKQINVTYSKKGAGKSLRGRGCVLASSPKRVEWPHPKLVHWWMLIHSSKSCYIYSALGLEFLYLFAS
jgi:hypothetical protein